VRAETGRVLEQGRPARHPVLSIIGCGVWAGLVKFPENNHIGMQIATV
jgi:hypothetical protein